ncbi:MAG: beta-N-acetylglucosaminidase domain-containing protein, partial [Polymorphobacter sp.]
MTPDLGGVPDLGIIEGYFGRSWDWPTRTAVMQRLHSAGYGFFHYAPKSDSYLRRRWREPYPTEQAADIAAFSRACDSAGVRFGVGLSPYELYRDFNAAARVALAAKLAFFDDIGVREVAILFDDMRGDIADLAARQAEIMAWVTAHSGASRFILCPTYYSDDAVLDRAFGVRPGRYLEDIGAALAPDVAVYWTGEEVCAREISVGHLRDVAARLGRKPLLWDNYPVNDGPRMANHLHLRGFTGRPAAIVDEIIGHAINPASQPWLSCLPALTLAARYRTGDAYRYMVAFTDAARALFGDALATRLQVDLLS